MATRMVEHKVDLATEIFTLLNTASWVGINTIMASLNRLGINYNTEELNSALNKLLHEKKIELGIGADDLTGLIANGKKQESPMVSLYFKRVATSD